MLIGRYKYVVVNAVVNVVDQVDGGDHSGYKQLKTSPSVQSTGECCQPVR